MKLEKDSKEYYEMLNRMNFSRFNSVLEASNKLEALPDIIQLYIENYMLDTIIVDPKMREDNEANFLRSEDQLYRILTLVQNSLWEFLDVVKKEGLRDGEYQEG